MPSDLQVSNIKDLTGSNTGLSIASDGQVTISQNNPTVTLGSNATGGSGLTAHGRIGHSIRLELTNNKSNASSYNILTDGWTQIYNDNTTIFENDTTNKGIKTKIAGKYLFQWSIYTYSSSNTSSQVGGYTQEWIREMTTGTNQQDSYTIYVRGDSGNTDNYRYMNFKSSCVLDCTANHVYGLRVYASVGTYEIVSTDTCITATYLS